MDRRSNSGFETDGFESILWLGQLKYKSNFWCGTCENNTVITKFATVLINSIYLLFLSAPKWKLKIL